MYQSLVSFDYRRRVVRRAVLRAGLRPALAGARRRLVRRAVRLAAGIVKPPYTCFIRYGCER